MRILIPVVAIAVGILFVLAIFFQQDDQQPTSSPDKVVSKQTRQTPGLTGLKNPSQNQGSPANADENQQPVTDLDAQADLIRTTQTPQTPLPSDKPTSNSTLGKLTILPPDAPDAPDAPDTPDTWQSSNTPSKTITLGTNRRASQGNGYKIKVDMATSSPAIERITLTDYAIHAAGEARYVVATPATTLQFNIYLMSPKAVHVNGQQINLSNAKWQLQQHTAGVQKDAATYTLTLADENLKPVLKITRRFELRVDSYDLIVGQSFENLSNEVLTVIWEQLAQGDAAFDGKGYRGDDRSFIAGYFNPEYDPSEKFIYTDDTVFSRTDVLALKDENKPFWPVQDLDEQFKLAWFASVSRYFALATHTLPQIKTDDQGQKTYRIKPMQNSFAKIGTFVIGQKGADSSLDKRQLAFYMVSKPFVIEPDQSKSLNLGLYAGPRDIKLFKKQPYASLWFNRMVVFTMGCTFCTFQPIAKALLFILDTLHYVVRDWGVAIILLVLFVRLLLHPITRKSQINMMKMGKQMQSIAPEIEKIKKKFQGDQTKIGQETMKLYREKGINPANFLGCLPMLLQSPIWIALYAMLYQVIDLRHQPAFYGFFQSISGGKWGFLKDLSAPDHFITLFSQPQFLWTIDYSSFNILPILMAAVFYIQQRLTISPAATDEQRRQQKMMGLMTVFLFPVFLYSAPSGLTLYIMASTSIGIWESHSVRKHIKELEEAGLLITPKKVKAVKPGSMRDRIAKAIENKQQDMLKSQRQHNKKNTK